MSDASAPLDPYRPPQDSTGARPGQGGRPGGLTAVCVTAIVLGAMGLCAALAGCGGLIVSRQMRQAIGGVGEPGGAEDMAEIRRRTKRMREEAVTIQERYSAWNVIFVAAHLVVASSLLAGGVLTWTFRPVGRAIFLCASCMAIPFELARGALQVLVNVAIVGAMSQFAQDQFPEAPEFANAVKVGMSVFLAFAVGFVLAKVAYYSIVIAYLRKPKVRVLFAAPRETAEFA